MNDELKPCPFCGGEAKRSEETYGVTFMSWVYCTSCGAQGASRHIEAEAAEAWNARATFGSGECEFVGDAKRTPKCSACGWQASIYDCEWLEAGEFEYDGSFCKQCGALVRKAVKR